MKFEPGLPVLTGIGIVSPIGIGRSEFWAGLTEGRTGVRNISLFDASSFPSKIAAEVIGFDASPYLSRRELKSYPRQTQFALVGLMLALGDAKLAALDPYRTDVVLGAAQISFYAIEEEIRKGSHALREHEPELDPFGVLKTTLSIPASAIAFRSGVKGYVSTLTSACTSGIDAIGAAADRIRQGQADAVITGGVDTPITRIILNAFCAARMLSTRNDEPQSALAPFDRSHTKSVLGEGAAILILEDKRRAIARGASIYCELGRFAQEPENTNELFSLDRSGTGWKRMLRNVLAEDGADSVEAINAHGPSDDLVDRVEADVLRDVFGARLHKIPAVSIKGGIGSSMAAAGAMQVASAALMLKTGIIPPTRNYSNPDPDCALNISAQVRRMKRPLGSVLVNAHGIGGMNSAILLKRVKV